MGPDLPALLLAGVALVALVAYAVSGGADFGGGVWDLFARGPRAGRQRDLIAHALAPIWEVNHIWLILVIVVLFVCFPVAFAAIATDLHIPLVVMLLGIVARGAAFTFRAYGGGGDADLRTWGRIFAVSSVVTPVMLGVAAGAVASGRLRLDPVTGVVQTDFVSSWLQPFPFVVGLLALVQFAFLAAVYLTLETDDAELRDDFRRRALVAGLLTGAVAGVALLLARRDAPLLAAGLLDRPWSPLFHVLTGLSAVGALAALVTRRWQLARLAALAQVALVIGGWGLAQFPYLVPPDLTVAQAAAPAEVLVPVLWTLGAGTVLLVPALVWLFRLFKRADAH